MVVLVGLGVGLVVAATMLVPWRVPRPTREARAEVLRDLPDGMLARGRALHAALRPSSYGSLLAGVAVVLLLGLTPAGARIVTWVAQPFQGHWLAEALLGGLVLLFTLWLVSLPFAARRHIVLRDNGLSTQGWAGWWVDVLKSLGVAAVTGAVVLAGFYTLTRLAPTWWWAFGAVAAAALMVVLSFVFPVVVEPLFNIFTPMPDGPLREELVTMAARDGIPVRDVLVADASRRTRGLNAYVSGLGTTRRLVVYDTLLREATPGEVRSVVAHELGHTRERDSDIGALLGALGAAAAVVAVYLLGEWDALLARAGVDSIVAPTAIGLVLAVLAVAGLVSGPVQNVVSRRIEARADQHALRLTGDPSEFAAMQLRLAEVNLADVQPPRIEYLLFATHPDTVERLAAALEYEPRPDPAP